ncbi:MAG: hypothetical protein WAT09_09490 [Paracoccaceae bacterium]
MRPFRLPLLLTAGLLILAAGCGRPPAIAAFDATASGPPPALLPIDDLLALGNAPSTAAARGEAVVSRAARLRHRASLMQGAVHDPATRARLAEAIRRGRA